MLNAECFDIFRQTERSTMCFVGTEEKWIIWKIEKSQVSERGLNKIARDDPGEASRLRVAASFDPYSRIYQRFESQISLYFPRVENTYLIYPDRGVPDFTLVAPYTLIVSRPQTFPRVRREWAESFPLKNMTGDSAKSCSKFLYSWRDLFGEWVFS